MVENGIYISGYQLAYWNTHTIDTSNTVNSKPVYYWKDQTSGTVPLGAGEVILANCTNVIVKNQNVSNGTVGIELGFSNNNTISFNNASSNYFPGIHLFSSANNTIANNTCSNNSDGIVLYSSSNNTIANNTYSNNSDDGIYLSSSDNNTIANNTVLSNNEGISLSSSSSGNTIYHNHLIDNTIQAIDDTNNGNQWNLSYPSGGNYWSDFDEDTEGAYDDFKGPDQDMAGSDGIVDNGFAAGGGKNPYYIDTDSKDNYPWIVSIDRIPPSISDVTAIPDPQNTQENVNISVVVVDNSPLFGVWVEIIDPEGDVIDNFPMPFDTVNERFYLNRTYDILGIYTFTISANDTVDNWASISDTFSIQDTIPPMIEDVTALPNPQEVLYAVNVSAIVTDNYPLFRARVKIYDPEENPIDNFTMLNDPVNGRYYWNQTYDALGTYTFTIWANDTSNQWDSESGYFVIATEPDAPIGLPATTGNSYVNISWTIPSSDGESPIIEYNIYRNGTAGVYHTVTSGQLWYNDTNVINGVTYTYNISATNVIGEGLKSIGVSATPMTIPSAPQNLQADAGDSYVNLSWGVPSSDGGSTITNYTIYKGTTSNEITLFAEIGNVRFYNDTDVTNSVKYYYKVGAKNAAGEGPLSIEVNATPIVLVNQLPTCNISNPKSGEIISGVIEINGTSSDVDGEVDRVEIKIDEGNWIWVTGTTSWSYSLDTTDFPNGQHTIYLRSYDGENYSSEASITIEVDNPKAEPEDMGWLWILILIIIVVLLTVALLVLRKRRPMEEEEEEEEEFEDEVPPPPPKKAMIKEIFGEGEEELAGEEEMEEVTEEEEIPPPPPKAKPPKKVSEEELDRLELPEPDEEL